MKGSSVTVSIAALLAAYTKPVSSAGRIGVLIAGLSAIPFWLTETYWKMFQSAYEDRIKAIELCNRDPVTSCAPMQIFTAWEVSFEGGPIRHWIESAFDVHVLLPHAPLLAAGVLFAIFLPPKA